MSLRVLFVSKPIAPPFRDGAKCLVRDVALNLQRARPVVMSVPGTPPLAELVSSAAAAAASAAVEMAPAYARAGSFSPTLRDNARAALWLLIHARADLWHYVFAPNPRTSSVARWLRRVRRVPVLQTVASPPRSFAAADQLLFGDVVVTQSRWTREQLLAGSSLGRERRIEVIPPPIGHVAERSPEARAAQRAELGIAEGVPVFVYPGDLEVSAGAETVASLVDPIARELPDAVFVFACRTKTPAAPAIAASLERRLGRERARFSSDPTDVLALVAGATAVLFPVDDLWGKVDLPITLLEAMSLGVPVVTWDHGPLRDLEGALRLELGDLEGLVRTCLELARLPERVLEVCAAQRDAVGRRFAAARVAAAYEALYEELARGRGAG